RRTASLERNLRESREPSVEHRGVRRHELVERVEHVVAVPRGTSRVGDGGDPEEVWEQIADPAREVEGLLQHRWKEGLPLALVLLERRASTRALGRRRLLLLPVPALLLLPRHGSP